LSNTANLQLPYLASGQAQKHITVNESLQRLDALVQLAVTSATTSAEPGSPTDGAIYILPSGKTGTHWGAMANGALAYYRDGAWEEITPREGFTAFVKDADTVLAFDGVSWIRIAPTYAEGTFTPTFTFETVGDLSVSYAQQSGVYRRIGHLMIVDARVSFTPTYTTATGTARFGGFNAQLSHTFFTSGTARIVNYSLAYPI
jgi:hypothetical protein